MKKYLFVFFLIAFAIVFPEQAYACRPCNPNGVNLYVDPDPVGTGQSVRFEVDPISEGTTCVGDSLGAGVNCSSCFVCDPVCHIDLTEDSDCNQTVNCTAPPAAGTYTFLHRWENTDPGDDCGDCPSCSKSIDYTVTDTPQPTVPPPTLPTNLLCPGEESIHTAIGCIPVSNITDFVAFLLRWGMGVGGGISFLLIIVAGFQIITSGGFPDKVQAGKQLLTAAISGLLLIIFSAFILHLFGVRILSLPGF